MTPKPQLPRRSTALPPAEGPTSATGAGPSAPPHHPLPHGSRRFGLPFPLVPPRMSPLRPGEPQDASMGMEQALSSACGIRMAGHPTPRSGPREVRRGIVRKILGGGPALASLQWGPRRNLRVALPFSRCRFESADASTLELASPRGLSTILSEGTSTHPHPLLPGRRMNVRNKLCPRCGVAKTVDQFGFRRLRNARGAVITYVQSWCRWCRAHPDSVRSDASLRLPL